MRDKLYTIVYMIIITAVATGVMTGTKVALQGRIELNEQMLEHREQLRGLGILKASEKADAQTVADLFETQVVIETRDGRRFLYAYKDEDHKVLMAIGMEFEGEENWGPVRGVMSFTPDGRQIRALTILSHRETPGLGGRITEAAFLEQFADRNVPEPDADGGIRIWQPTDAITGATRTSESMEKILNQAVEDYMTLTGNQD